MAEYTGPSTTNRAVMIETGRGRLTPDIYATCGPNHTGSECECKLGNPHPSMIYNDPYDKYGVDTPESEAW